MKKKAKKLKVAYHDSMIAGSDEVRAIVMKYAKKVGDEFGEEESMQVSLNILTTTLASYLSAVSNIYPDITKEVILSDCFAAIEHMYDGYISEDNNVNMGALH